MSAIDIRKIFQELVIPELQEIKSNLKILTNRMDSMDKEINSRLESLGSRMDSLEREIINSRDDIKSLRAEFKLAIDIHERLASLEALIHK